MFLSFCLPPSVALNIHYILHSLMLPYAFPICASFLLFCLPIHYSLLYYSNILWNLFNWIFIILRSKILTFLFFFFSVLLSQFRFLILCWSFQFCPVPAWVQHVSLYSGSHYCVMTEPAILHLLSLISAPCVDAVSALCASLALAICFMFLKYL